MKWLQKLGAARRKVKRRHVVFGTAVAAAAGTAGYLSQDAVGLIGTLLQLLLIP